MVTMAAKGLTDYIDFFPFTVVSKGMIERLMFFGDPGDTGAVAWGFRCQDALNDPYREKNY